MLKRKVIFVLLLAVGTNVCIAQQENFDEFLYKFSHDSTFQLSRVDFPLKHIFIDDEIFELDSGTISKADYCFYRFHYTLYERLDAYPVFYDNFEGKLRDTGERVFRWRGFTGRDDRYYFKRINGRWFLVRIENIGT